MKNILLIRNDRFGEFLLIIPAIRALKESYPQARITLAVSSQVKELAGLIEYVDEVFVWDEVKKDLRRHKFDLCVILNPTKEAHMASFLAGIPSRLGYNRKWGFLLTHKIADTKGLGLKHEVESNLELVSVIGAKTKDQSISLGKLPAFSNSKYEGAVAVHPYTSDSVKDWSADKFRALISKLAKELGCKLIIIGKQEYDYQHDDFYDVSAGIINLVNKTTLVELAQILKLCRLLITCDSGPMHLAEAVGTPLIAIFRNDLPGKCPRRWAPRSRESIVIEGKNLADISVESVFDKAKEVLKT